MSVYFITARQVGKVKIGCAYDPHVRLEKLQAASPVELTIEALMRGSHQEERALHARFAAHRLHGEWFDLAPEIELMIATFPAPKRLTKAEMAALMPPRRKREPGESHELFMLRKRLERGDIHFPFREGASA